MFILPKALLQCLHDRLGLNPNSINKQSLMNAVRSRMRVCQVDDPHQYTIIAQKNHAEFLQLIEQIIVPETSFFRHANAFVHLRHTAEKYKEQKKPLRVLCVPSSTGEEPYSIAMCLLDDGWQSKDFTIDALDISSNALTLAKEGVYHPYSFRGDMIQSYMHFFTATTKGYQIADSVKTCVCFHQRNILDADYLLALGRYPIVFCRNLLIYLHKKARCKVSETVSTLLEKDGTLFAGNAENSTVWHDFFVSSRIPMSFAMQHSNPLITTRRFSFTPSLLKKPSTQRPIAAKPKQSPITLTTIRAAADKKDMMNVIHQCQTLLAKEPNNAVCYFYFALADVAQGKNAAAIKKLRKAIYLKPDYQEALKQLASLLEKQGDSKTAQRMYQRLQIVRKHSQHE